MKPHGLIAATGVLAILGGYAWWANKNPTPEAASTVPVAPKILALNADQIQSIKLTKTGADSITVAR